MIHEWKRCLVIYISLHKTSASSSLLYAVILPNTHKALIYKSQWSMFLPFILMPTNCSFSFSFCFFLSFSLSNMLLIAGYSIYWNQRLIKVFRADVECTNGIIHVIDHPFLEESDIRVTSGSNHLHTTTATTFGSIMVSILVAVVAKLFV